MNESATETRLTDEGFWEHFWTAVKIPARVNTRGSIDRALTRLFIKFVPHGQGKSLIEIGAAPGRWLVFFREELGYEVDGVEYVASACRKTEENMAACGTKGRVFQQDFFRNDLPKHSYDAVLSIGFIEHFTDLDPVVTGHIALLKPGGVLILGVPNLRGLHGAVERWTDPDAFAVHNLEVMSVPFMERLSAEYELVPLWIGYTAGINPGLITVADDKGGDQGGLAAILRRRRPALLRFILRSLNYIRNRFVFLDRLNGPLISSNLLAIYRYSPCKEDGVAAGHQ